ncbi:nucleotide-diphospho-sugar transferase [Rhizoctonia solani]|nr:nucleotide-diphospho-sugar transferase [Rhizoctonia solani]
MPAKNEDEETLQAVILADSFNTKFEPLSVDTPRVLLPVCNAPLLDWTFECLASAGVDEVFVFCVAHVDQIKEAIEQSQWSKPSSGMSITTIVSREARSVGDAMRELDAKQILTSDFVLLTGDVVSNIRLDEVIKEHKERRKVSKDAIMTCVVKEVGKAHRSKPVSEKNVFVLDAHTNECVYYEYQQANPPKQNFGFLREIFDKHPDVDVRTDLMDCSIDICSVDVPVLFTENFDYQDLRKDFMHGVLTSDILGKTMYCHIARSGYAARVRDTRSYAAVSCSKDIISRWSFPLVPDNNHPAQHDYDYRAGNKYIANRADLSRNSRIGKNTMIGPSTRAEDDAFVTNTVLGTSCEIGSGSTISGSYLFDQVHVGIGCDIVDSIIADGVRLERGVKLAKGCIIAKGVVLGEGTVLPPFSRVSREQPEEVEDWEGREEGMSGIFLIKTNAHSGIVELGPGSSAWVWPNDKCRQLVEAEYEDEDEEETFANVRLGRLADTCSDIETYESDQASTLASESESESDITPPISPTSSTSDLPGLPSLDAASDFQSECTQSLKRAFDEEHTVDNAAIELKTLRMASNVPLPQVREAVINYIIQKLSDEDAGRPEVKKVFTRWGALLKQIGGYDEAETLLQFQRACSKTPERSRLFPAVLTELYQNELIEEDGLTEWFIDPQSKGANSRLNPELHAPYDQLRVIGGQLLQQLRAQDSEEESDEDE